MAKKAQAQAKTQAQKAQAQAKKAQAQAKKAQAQAKAQAQKAQAQAKRAQAKTAQAKTAQANTAQAETLQAETVQADTVLARMIQTPEPGSGESPTPKASARKRVRKAPARTASNRPASSPKATTPDASSPKAPTRPAVALDQAEVAGAPGPARAGSTTRRVRRKVSDSQASPTTRPTRRPTRPGAKRGEGQADAPATAARAPRVRSQPGECVIALSTASVYPESTAHAFDYAARLGYDAVEVMVGIDGLSQQISAVQQLAEHHQMPVCAIHAPCLLFTQRVWGTEPWGKLERSAEMAHAVGADVVVVHPPFRWQRDYALGFVEGIAALEESTGIAFAVENMYPWRASDRRGMEMYLPSWDPSTEPYANTTIDLSHAAIAKSDVIAMAERLGPRLRHIHLTDGSGSAKDEHLVPGRGVMGAADFLTHLTSAGFGGHVVLEINTRKATSQAERERDLAESLEFARTHLGAPRR